MNLNFIDEDIILCKFLEVKELLGSSSLNVIIIIYNNDDDII